MGLDVNGLSHEDFHERHEPHLDRPDGHVRVAVSVQVIKRHAGKESAGGKPLIRLLGSETLRSAEKDGGLRVPIGEAHDQLVNHHVGASVPIQVGHSIGQRGPVLGYFFLAPDLHVPQERFGIEPPVLSPQVAEPRPVPECQQVLPAIPVQVDRLQKRIEKEGQILGSRPGPSRRGCCCCSTQGARIFAESTRAQPSVPPHR